MPILHLHSFAEEYESFWIETNQVPRHDVEVGTLLRKNPSFLCLLSSILFATLASTPSAQLASIFDNSDTALRPAEMYHCAMLSASLVGFPRRPTLYSLAAYIFAQSQFVREEEFSDSPDFISTAFRIALGMGLHRNLNRVGFTISQRETRRRLWWYIIHLDVMSSCSSGLSPLFLDEKMANAQEITLYDQEDDDSGNLANEGEKPQPECVLYFH